PNLSFSFKKKHFNRIFPRQEYKNLNTDNIIESINLYFKNQIKWLDNNYEKVYLSLTGGFDSKVSLALVKPIIKKVMTFTYMYKDFDNKNYKEMTQYRKIYYRDKYIVDKLVDNFLLNHKYYYFEEYKAPSYFI